MKTLWFSKAGKITAKVLLWIVVWFLSIVWLWWVVIVYHSLYNDADIADINQMFENYMNEKWFSVGLWRLSDYKFSIFWKKIYTLRAEDNSNPLMENNRFKKMWADIISIDNNFTWYFIKWDKWPLYLDFDARYININEFYKSFYNDIWETIYWDLVLTWFTKDWKLYRPWDFLEIWKRYHNLLVEFENAGSVWLMPAVEYNSEYKNFRNKSYNFNWNFRSTHYRSKGWIPCLILWNQNPVNDVVIREYPECKYIFISNPEVWYDRQMVSLTVHNKQDSEDEPTIKITPIEIEEIYE